VSRSSTLQLVNAALRDERVRRERLTGDLDLPPICLDCVRNAGLCQRCAMHVCPQLAKNRGYLALIGEVHTEQKRRQGRRKKKGVPELTKSPEQQSWLKRRAGARAVARSKRRGYFGLARAIAGIA
jgi:hypothetical protein